MLTSHITSGYHTGQHRGLLHHRGPAGEHWPPWRPLPEFWEWLCESGWYLFKLSCELLGITQSSKNSVSPWTTNKITNLACTREWLLCAEWHVSCITAEVESAGMLTPNSIRIVFKYHVSSVVFGTFLWLHGSSKMKPPSVLHKYSYQRPRWWCHTELRKPEVEWDSSAGNEG